MIELETVTVDPREIMRLARFFVDASVRLESLRHNSRATVIDMELATRKAYKCQQALRKALNYPAS